MLNRLKKIIGFKTNSVSYTCACCGKKHYSWPALGYDAPAHHSALSPEEQSSIASLTSDFCVINHPDETSRFIRATLSQHVTDACEDLEYGLWVSLSEKSFEDYKANFNNPEHDTGYFGWISNNLMGYERTINIPADVKTRPGGSRPEVIPHQDFDHPFVHDYYNGIDKKEAEQRIKDTINNIS